MAMRNGVVFTGGARGFDGSAVAVCFADGGFGCG